MTKGKLPLLLRHCLLIQLAGYQLKHAPYKIREGYLSYPYSAILLIISYLCYTKLEKKSQTSNTLSGSCSYKIEKSPFTEALKGKIAYNAKDPSNFR